MSPPDVLLPPPWSARLCAQLRGKAAFVTPALCAPPSPNKRRARSRRRGAAMLFRFWVFIYITNSLKMKGKVEEKLYFVFLLKFQ